MPEPATKHQDFDAKIDPLFRLEDNILCNLPPKELTREQQFAMHEFFHSVLSAGYKLYQIVPADIAAPIIRDKFRHMVANPRALE